MKRTHTVLVTFFVAVLVALSTLTFDTASASSAAQVTPPTPNICAMSNVRSALTATSLRPLNGNQALLATFDLSTVGNDLTCTFAIVVYNSARLSTIYWRTADATDTTASEDLAVSTADYRVFQNDGGEVVGVDVVVADVVAGADKTLCYKTTPSFGVCQGRLERGQTLTVYVTHRMTSTPADAYPSTVLIGEWVRWSFHGYGQWMPVMMR